MWSPDGSAIAYYHQAEGLHVVDPDGGHDRLLGVLPNSPYFAFSRDWHWLALAVYENVPGRATIEVMRPDGSEQRVVGTGSCCAAPVFSPDGSRLVYADGGALVVVNVDGSGSTRVATQGSYPRWSPDGGRLSYSIPTLTGPHVVLSALDGAPVVDLGQPLFGTAPTRGATWSRDGRIAFVAGSPTRIAVYDLDTAELRAYRVDSAAFLEWSPDGTRILFADAHGLTQLDVASGSLTLVDGGGGKDGNWSPDGAHVAYSATGECGDRAAIYVDGRRATDDCRVFGTDGPDTLTSSNTVFQIVLGLGGDDTLVARGAPFVGSALDGGPGNDTLVGSRWRDRLTGGTGRDVLRGGPGPDVLFARDGEPDLVDCGTGADKAYVDPLDLVVNCEKVYRSR